MHLTSFLKEKNDCFTHLTCQMNRNEWRTSSICRDDVSTLNTASYFST